MTDEFAINILEQYREKPTLINEIETVEEAVWLDEALDMAIKALGQKPKTEWIPIASGRLPEEGEKVLTTHLGGINPDRQVIEHIYVNGSFTHGWDLDTDVNSPTFGQRYMGEIIAWMPEPEPYTAEGSDKE